VVLPDGHRVAIAVRGLSPARGGIVVWDTREAPQAVPVPVITRATVVCVRNVWPSVLAVLRDGRVVFGDNDNNFQVMNVDAGVMETTLCTGNGKKRYVMALAALPDGNLASASSDRLVWLWDVDAGVCTAKLKGHTNDVDSLVVLFDGRLASGSEDGTVRLWDVGSRTCVGVLQGYKRALVVLPGGSQLANMSTGDKLLVWDTRDAVGAPVLELRQIVELAGSAARLLVYLPDGRLATGGHGVRLWKLPLDDFV